MARVIIMIQPLHSDFLILVDRVRQGDAFAWEELHRIYNPKLRRVIRAKLRAMNNRVRDLYDTCDFSSELWGVLYSKLPSLQISSESDLLGFLTKAAQDKICDATRRQTASKRNSSRTCSLESSADEDSGGIEPPSHEPTPSKYAMANELTDAIHSQCNEMGFDSSLIMQLKTQHYTNQEVSEQTGIHVRKVQRVVNELRKRLLNV